MLGRASKQTYLGRVIAPAKFHAGTKPFLSFTLFVDRLAVGKGKEKERTSGKIGCSYSLNGENDPVGLILCRIASKDDPAQGGLAGQAYKSVEVFVEGTERLTEVADKEGNTIPNAYYKSLDYCSLQVVDSDVLKLYKKHLEKDSPQEESVEQPTTNTNPFTDNTSAAPQQNHVQQPTQAPVAQTRVVTQPAAQQPKKTGYQVGDKIMHNGTEFEFRGGNSADLKNWYPVKQAPVVEEKPANPFEAAETVSNNPFEQ